MYKTLSNLYDMDQICNIVNVRSFFESNSLYTSCTISNKQGLLHPTSLWTVWTTKLVHEIMIFFGIENISTLIGKSMEIVDIMTKRRINFMCLQETK